MTSTQEIHHLPVEGEEFHIQDCSFWEAPKRKQPVCKHKPHKKHHTFPEHKCENKCEHKWFNHDESDSDTHCTSESDSCLEFSYESSSGCSTPRRQKSVCKPTFKKCFEFDEHSDCKDRHKEFLICSGEFHDCDHKHKECLHCGGKGHRSFDCEHRFKKGITCAHKFRHTSFECIGHSRLCLFELIRRFRFFGCHRPKPWPKAHKKHN